MNKFKSILGVAICGVILGVAYTASAEVGKPGYATAVRVQGAVSYTLDNNNWYPLVPGKYLAAGASIRTGENGTADIVLGHTVPKTAPIGELGGVAVAPDSAVRGLVAYQPVVEQNVVRLTPNSELAIDKLTTIDSGVDTVSDTELDLKKGKIYASVKKLSGASQYLVKIPNGIAGVRGTEFSISADGATAVFHTRGSDGLVLSLTMPGGTTTTLVIDQGQFYLPGSSQPAQLPPAVMTVLSDIFDALKTIRLQGEVSFDYNHNEGHVSTDIGRRNQVNQ